MRIILYGAYASRFQFNKLYPCFFILSNLWIYIKLSCLISIYFSWPPLPQPAVSPETSPKVGSEQSNPASGSWMQLDQVVVGDIWMKGKKEDPQNIKNIKILQLIFQYSQNQLYMLPKDNKGGHPRHSNTAHCSFEMWRDRKAMAKGQSFRSGGFTI